MTFLRKFSWPHKRYLTWGSCLGIGSISIYLLSQSMSIDFYQYQSYRDSIIQLQRLDQIFKQEILKSRYELFASYDPLVRNIEAQEKTLEHIRAIPGFIQLDAKQDLERLIEQSQNTLRQKEDMSEWFKSRNALLKNSLRYLPFLTEQLDASLKVSQTEITATTAPPTSPPLSNENISTILTSQQFATINRLLNQLMRSLLLFSASGDDSLAERSQTLVKSITELENTLEIPEDQLPTRLFRSHANVILTTKPLVEDLTDQLIQSQSQSNQSLEERFESAFLQSRRRTSLFQVISAIWFLSLLIFGNYIILRRFNRINPVLQRYQRYVKRLGQTALKLQSEPLNDQEMLVLASYLKREDAFSPIAKGLLQLGEITRQHQAALQEESFAIMTARLSLITKQRRNLLTPNIWETIREIFETILIEFQCHPLEITGDIDQALMTFSYPLTLSLSQLIQDLKRKSADIIVQSSLAKETLGSVDDVWSDAYFITSCDVSPQATSDIALSTAGDVK